MNYLYSLLSQISIAVIEVAALDLLVGFAGINSFGHAAFIGIGAYAAALLLTVLHAGFAVALLGALAVPAAVALLVGLPTLRLSGDYFILGTIGLAMVTSSILANWVDVTNGPFGILGIPALTLPGFKADTPLRFLLASVVAAALVLAIKHLLIASPLGITLRGIREDETVAAVLGKNVTRIRITIFALGAAGAGIGGLLTAYDLRFIDPTLFDMPSVIFLWAALFVGGCGSALGNIIGPLILLSFPEALRFVGLEGTAVAHVRELLYGLLLILVTIYRPQGIAGKYRLH